MILHKGAFQAKGLHIRVSIVPVFQKVMDNLVAGFKGVMLYFDYIVIGAGSMPELVILLQEVLWCISNALA